MDHLDAHGHLEVDLGACTSESHRQGECLSAICRVHTLEYVDSPWWSGAEVVVADQPSPGFNDADVFSEALEAQGAIGLVDDVAAADRAEVRISEHGGFDASEPVRRWSGVVIGEADDIAGAREGTTGHRPDSAGLVDGDLVDTRLGRQQFA